MLIITFMIVMMSFVNGEGVPSFGSFHNLKEIKRGMRHGLIISECQPGDEPSNGVLAKISYCLSIQPVLYNLERLPCNIFLQKYNNRSMADLRNILYLKFKSALQRLPRNTNLSRLIRNHICYIEKNEVHLPSLKPFNWPTLIKLKCDIKEVAIAYSEKVSDTIVKVIQ